MVGLLGPNSGIGVRTSSIEIVLKDLGSKGFLSLGVLVSLPNIRLGNNEKYQYTVR